MVYYNGMYLSEGEWKKEKHLWIIYLYIDIYWVYTFVYTQTKFVSTIFFLEVNLYKANLVISGHSKIETQVGLASEPSLLPRVQPRTPGLYICAPIP